MISRLQQQQRMLLVTSMLIVMSKIASVADWSERVFCQPQA